MSWPYSRLTSYIPSKPPVVASTDLNQIQDALISLQSVPVRLQDDFVDFIDPLPTVGGSRYFANVGGSNGIKIANDSSNHAFGSLFLPPAVSADRAVQAFSACGIGTGDFRLMFRCATPTPDGSRTTFVGLSANPTIDASSYGFAVGSSSNWTAITGGSQHGTPGVAAGSGYKTIEMSRLSGVLNFFVDGTLDYSVSNAVDLSALLPTWYTFRGDLMCDWWGL